ncbi:MAG: thioesterase [Sulfurovum sp.]|nr:thioesterase [Sulfurovum sp.]
MQTLQTHLSIDTSLSGRVVIQKDNFSRVLLNTTHAMRADSQGLVHGGFIFGAADYAAMCAVNDPYVVLGSSSSKFIAAVKVGDAVILEAKVVSLKGKKREVKVIGKVEDREVFEGIFTTFVLDKHVLG